ncbi:MAG: Eco57I restriction-modification methylase domain-containing protein [bacterium]
MKIERQALHHQYSNEQRKLLGMHYTPDAIIDYIVRRSLQPYFEKGDFELIRDIAIVDPACGSGLFLLKAFDLLCSFRKQHSGSLHAKDVRYILENNLYGVDIDASAVHTARGRLMRRAEELGVKAVNLERNILQGDALMWPAFHPQLEMFELFAEGFPWHQKFPRVFDRGGFDCVVSNPPYVRIQRIQPLERRAKYAELYETARGRFDVAGLFIELADGIARPGGRIGYVVSDKLLSTDSASRLRDYILTHYTLVEIVDLVDTKLFSAAILPMILIIEKGPAKAESFVYASVQEGKATRYPPPSVERLLAPLERNLLPLREDVEWNGRHFRVEKFESPLPTRHQGVWTFHHPTERKIVEKLRENAVCTLGSIAYKIGVGLKTTADDVFIKPMTLDFVRRHKLEREVIFPILESHNIERWRCDWKPERDLYVLYPHREKDGKVIPVCLERYPNAERYLLSNRKRLEARTYLKESGRRWYEIWVHQSPRDFERLKLVTPDIAPRNRFALDDRKFFVNGTCFYIILRDRSFERNLLVLALLNSKALEFFHKATSGNVLYAKRFRYWASYLKSYPIPDITHPRNSGVVKKLVENTRGLIEISDEQETIALEKENDSLAYQLFELTDSEVEEVESSLAFKNR